VPQGSDHSPHGLSLVFPIFARSDVSHVRSQIGRVRRPISDREETSDVESDVCRRPISENPQKNG